MINLTVNGRIQQLESEMTGQLLLERLDRNAATLVIELNGRIIPLEEFRETTVSDGDVLELVTLVGGG